MPSLSRRLLLALGLAGLVSRQVPSALAAERPFVLIFMSDTSERTLAIVQAFKEHLDFATRLTYDLSQEEDAGAFIADQIRGLDVALVFAIGDKAYKAATREFSSTPVLYTDAPNETSIGLIEEVSSAVDPASVVTRLKAVSPTLTSLGVVRTPADVPSTIEAITAACEAAGVKAEVRSVSGAGETANVLSILYRTVDMIWLRPDPAVWTGTALASAYYEAALQKVAMIGFDRTHLEAPHPPAFVVISSPSGLGHTAGARAVQLLRGEEDEQSSFVEAILIGHMAGLRAAGVSLTRKRAALLDELVR